MHRKIKKYTEEEEEENHPGYLHKRRLQRTNISDFTGTFQHKAKNYSPNTYKAETIKHYIMSEIEINGCF